MLRALGKLMKLIFILVIIVILLAVCLFVYARFVEPNRLQVNEVRYESEVINEPVTIAVFADTHFGFRYDLEQFNKVIQEINANPPDILVFGGDLIDNLDLYPGNTDEISAALSKLKAKDGKYAVFGNHDYGGGAEHKYEDIMKSGGFQVLVNQAIDLDRYNMSLIGIDDLLIGYGNPRIAQKAKSGRYNLVLCHEPDVLDQIAGSNNDLMITGHSHGGQIRIPFYSSKFLPPYGRKYVKGEYRSGNINLYVNSGLGTTKIPARLFAPPELTYITISRLPGNTTT